MFCKGRKDLSDLMLHKNSNYSEIAPQFIQGKVHDLSSPIDLALDTEEVDMPSIDLDYSISKSLQPFNMHFVNIKFSDLKLYILAEKSKRTMRKFPSHNDFSTNLDKKYNSRPRADTFSGIIDNHANPNIEFLSNENKISK